MNRGIYPILSGALAQEQRLQTISNNLANVNTTAYKRDELLFRSLLARAGVVTRVSPGADRLAPIAPGISRGARIFVSLDGLKTDLEPARLRATGNPLDLAIRGTGYFEIYTPQGIRYTRNGAFHLDDKRRLVTEAGYPVMGLKGELKLPPGDPYINGVGVIEVNGQEVGTIKIVDFPPETPPQKIGEGLFAGQSAKPAKDVSLAVGHLEESTVNPMMEMVKLIEVMRMFESAQKVIQTMDRMAEMAIQDVGRVV